MLNGQNTRQTVARLPVSRRAMNSLFHMPVDNVTARVVAMEPSRHVHLSGSRDY